MQYVKLVPESNDLVYAKDGDAGMDLAVTEFVALAAFGDEHSKRLMPTGLAVKIPYCHFGLIVPRSSMGKRGIMLANTCGIIDSGYTGELKLFLQNMTNEVQYIEKGDKVAQLIILPFQRVMPELVDKLPETERGSGGFGHTGR